MTSLSVVSYIERINRMYRLIRKESTGSRAELAGRMRVSERTVSNYLEELRLMPPSATKEADLDGDDEEAITFLPKAKLYGLKFNVNASAMLLAGIWMCQNACAG